MTDTQVAPARPAPPATSHLRVADGRVLRLDVGRWMGATDRVDEDVLDRAVGPVLDVGCGPGRHVGALHRRGVETLGVDLSPTAVALARRRGAPVVQQSVFDALPGHGRWRTALLLDGSVGIGGDPVALLRRVRELLHPAGRVLVEVEPRHVATESVTVRVETARGGGPWFRWAFVSATAIGPLAQRIGLGETDRWEDAGRHFSALARLSLSA